MVRKKYIIYIARSFFDQQEFQKEEKGGDTIICNCKELQLIEEELQSLSISFEITYFRLALGANAPWNLTDEFGAV